MIELNGVAIDDTFAEAFSMTGTRVLITAATQRWAHIAATQMTGFATSVIACDCEAGIERMVAAEDTPDGRPGCMVLMFAFNRESLAAAVGNRVGQCVLTCPTTACYSGVEAVEKDKQISIGGAIRFFGDSFQFSKKLEGRRYWRLPVMDGEFVCEDRFGTFKGVGGGNLLLCGVDQPATLAAAETAIVAMRTIRGIITPFPGGLVRSGSKVGSRYKKLKASTNDAFCPTLRPLTEAAIPDDCNAVYEIVVDGVTFEDVQGALRAGLHAACAMPGLKRVTAGNYGGKLGKHHFHLRDLL